MPQLDITTYSSQLFWLVICFFSMLFLMSKWIIPMIVEIMDQRQRKINDNLSQAEEFHDRAEAAMEKYHAALDKATAKANQSLAETQTELKALIDAKTNEMNVLLQKKVQESEAEIGRNKEAALKQVREIALSLAGDVAAKIGATEISDKDIHEALSELKVSNDE